jgi:UDP-N-acetylmuramoylalanine-D-glutamate ligase
MPPDDRPAPEVGTAAQLPDLAGRPVVVAGLGITGQSACALLAGQGAMVTAVDSRDDAERRDNRRLPASGR